MISAGETKGVLLCNPKYQSCSNEIKRKKKPPKRDYSSPPIPPDKAPRGIRHNPAGYSEVDPNVNPQEMYQTVDPEIKVPPAKPKPKRPTFAALSRQAKRFAKKALISNPEEFKLEKTYPKKVGAETVTIYDIKGPKATRILVARSKSGGLLYSFNGGRVWESKPFSSTKAKRSLATIVKWAKARANRKSDKQVVLDAFRAYRGAKITSRKTTKKQELESYEMRKLASADKPDTFEFDYERQFDCRGGTDYENCRYSVTVLPGPGRKQRYVVTKYYGLLRRGGTRTFSFVADTPRGRQQVVKQLVGNLHKTASGATRAPVPKDYVRGSTLQFYLKNTQHLMTVQKFKHKRIAKPKGYSAPDTTINRTTVYAHFKRADGKLAKCRIVIDGFYHRRKARVLRYKVLYLGTPNNEAGPWIKHSAKSTPGIIKRWFSQNKRRGLPTTRSLSEMDSSLRTDKWTKVAATPYAHGTRDEKGGKNYTVSVVAKRTGADGNVRYFDVVIYGKVFANSNYKITGYRVSYSAGRSHVIGPVIKPDSISGIPYIVDKWFTSATP